MAPSSVLGIKTKAKVEKHMLDWISGEHGLWVLFSTGFLSATLLPGGSEAHLLFLIKENAHSISTLIFIATLGNTLGGMTNYLIGRCFPLKKENEKQTQKAIDWLQRHGYFGLLLSWVPLIGDPLCVAAGWLRLNMSGCLFFIGIGKTLRYCLLAFVLHDFFPV